MTPVHIPRNQTHQRWLLTRPLRLPPWARLGSAFARFIPSPGRLTPHTKGVTVPTPAQRTRAVIQTRDYRRYRIFTDGSFRYINYQMLINHAKHVGLLPK